MQTISAALSAFYASGATTLARCWKVTRQDGTIFGFTEHDQDIIYLNLTYLASSGVNATAIASSCDLSVDNLEVDGMLTSPAITEDDLNSKKWDNAAFVYFEVNYTDLTMGQRTLRVGTLGQVVVHRNAYVAELRGMFQRLQQTVGRLITPTCDANLGDARCGVNLAAGGLTVTGSVTNLLDSHSFVDTARIETNSTIQKAITEIGLYNATYGTWALGNPTVITCPAHGLSAGQQVTISGVSGLPNINGLTMPIAYIDANTFSISIDSTSWQEYIWNGTAYVWVNPAYAPNLFQVYIGGGLVTQAVPSEFFQGGLLTWTSGANVGIEMECKAYRPNYVYLAEAMYNPIAVGDTYTMTAGCDKIKTTCISRFNNVVNFRGFAELPGNDKMIAGA